MYPSEHRLRDAPFHRHLRHLRHPRHCRHCRRCHLPSHTIRFVLVLANHSKMSDDMYTHNVPYSRTVRSTDVRQLDSQFVYVTRDSA